MDILPLKKHIYYLDSSSDELKNVPGYKTYYESVNDFSGDEVQEQALAQYPDSDNIFKIISQIDGKWHLISSGEFELFYKWSPDIKKYRDFRMPGAHLSTQQLMFGYNSCYFNIFIEFGGLEPVMTDSINTESTYSYMIFGELVGDYAPGVYIQDTSGVLWDVDQWDSQVFNAVAIVGEDHQFIVHDKSYKSNPYSNTTKAITGVVTTTNKQIALTDFDGIGNTDKIISQTGNANIAYACKTFKFPNGQSGYLPSAGETGLLYAYFHEFNVALRSANKEYLIGPYMNVSTQYQDGYHWLMGTNNANIHGINTEFNTNEIPDSSVVIAQTLPSPPPRT